MNREKSLVNRDKKDQKTLMINGSRSWFAVPAGRQVVRGSEHKHKAQETRHEVR